MITAGKGDAEATVLLIAGLLHQPTGRNGLDNLRGKKGRTNRAYKTVPQKPVELCT